MSLNQLRELCVTEFAPLSSTRAPIMDGLESVVKILVEHGIECAIWVDGSFLTEKIDPEDVDILFELTERAMTSWSSAQRATVKWLDTDEPKVSYHCDGYIWVNDPSTAKTEWMRAYWVRQFGFDRESKTMKGMAKLILSASGVSIVQ